MKCTMCMAFPDRPRMRCFEKVLLTHSWNRRKGENNVPRNIKHKALYNCITFSLQSSLKNMKMCLSIKNCNLQQCWYFFKCQSVQSYYNGIVLLFSFFNYEIKVSM